MTTISLSIKDRDRGFKRLVRNATSRKGARALVKVGIFGANARMQVEGADETAGQVALIHEFGATVSHEGGATTVIPKRSIIAEWFDEGRPRFIKMMRKAAADVAFRDSTKGQELDTLGKRLADEVRQRILNGEIKPPNAPSTIRRKGSSTPLIAEDRWIVESIDHEVKGA